MKMTREEAIKNIKEHCYFASLHPQAKEALDVSIKALEQEPCEDAVSRDAVLDLVADYDLSMGQVVRGIHNLPSVYPQPILDKIRAEIEQLPTKTRTNWDGCCPDFNYPEIEYVDVSKNKLLSIIDKYKAESEE